MTALTRGDRTSGPRGSSPLTGFTAPSTVFFIETKVELQSVREQVVESPEKSSIAGL
jgi:hypothetical protein